MKDNYFTVHGGRTLERIHYTEDGERQGQVFNEEDGKWDWRPCETAEKIYYWDYLDWTPCSESEAQAMMEKLKSE